QEDDAPRWKSLRGRALDRIVTVLRPLLRREEDARAQRRFVQLSGRFTIEGLLPYVQDRQPPPARGEILPLAGERGIAVAGCRQVIAHPAIGRSSSPRRDHLVAGITPGIEAGMSGEAGRRGGERSAPRQEKRKEDVSRHAGR